MSTTAENIAHIGPHIEGGAPTAEIDRIFDLQVAKSLRLRTSSADERIAKLKKMRQALMDRQEEIHAVGKADFRKPEAESDLTELMPVVAEINHTIKHLKKWMKPKKVRPSLALLGTSSYIQHDPKGVVLIIAPWNYSLNLCFGPLVSAIAAGCTAILKPSEMTTHCAEFMQKFVADVFTEDEVALFQGGPEVSQALLDKPFNHIFFTGSPQIGKVIMGAAAKHLTSVTLELGGKSPFIVDKSANLDQTAKKLAWGKFLNNGQTCIAPDHVYVHDEVHDDLVEKLRAQLNKNYGSNVKATPDYARMVNERHHQRVVSILDDAREKGARVAIGGESDNDENYLAPTVITDASDDTRAMQEEIFGPVLPMRRFSNIDEPIREINARPKPLALYVFSRDKQVTRRVLSETAAGTSCVNHCMVQFLHANLPFGGVNNSGIGHGHGYWGFMAFSHERPVVKEQFSSTWLFNPPYTGIVRKLINMTIRWLV